MKAAGLSWQPAARKASTSSMYVSAIARLEDEEMPRQSPLAMADTTIAPRAARPLKFYLVEDNAIIRENLAETLHDLVGAEVVGVSEAQSDATRWLCDPTHEWDVAVVDIFLKLGNGIQVVAALQGVHRQRRIIVLTNYASTEVRSECLRLGADAVFDKSTELDDLIEFCAKVQLH